jgi:protein-S-isoprenylcysteine O-methyltransferase Ste14
MRKRLIRWTLVVVTITGVLFGLAGTWRDPWLWAFAIVWAGATLYGITGVDDALLKERFRPPHSGADRVALAFVRVFALALIVLGVLDSGRWHVAPVTSGVRALGLAGMAVGFGLFFRAMHENRFFSAVVRIQSDRGHRVVDSGPYSVVRHPGYAGMLVAMPCAGLALGSFIAFALGVALSLMIVRRAGFEDAFLRGNLEGYPAYSARVPYRLVPGLW